LGVVGQTDLCDFSRSFKFGN